MPQPLADLLNRTWHLPGVDTLFFSLLRICLQVPLFQRDSLIQEKRCETAIVRLQGHKVLCL